MTHSASEANYTRCGMAIQIVNRRACPYPDTPIPRLDG